MRTCGGWPRTTFKTNTAPQPCRPRLWSTNFTCASASSVQDVEWQSRGQFISVAAQIMRRILIDHARKRQRVKRDPGPGVPFEEAIAPPDFDVLVVDQALQRMTSSFPRHPQIVELRFFGGLDSPEIAEALGISLRTVERDWRFARAWLQNEISA